MVTNEKMLINKTEKNNIKQMSQMNISQANVVKVSINGTKIVIICGTLARETRS